MLQKVIFSDRDGVINRDSPNYIKSRAEFEFLPGSLEAIRLLTECGYTIIVITNQSAVARKLTTPEELNAIHAMMCKTVKKHGGRITDIFFCPHLPDEKCLCRKPKPGLIYQAKQRYDIDIAHAVMVGDSAKDIECARQAGCGQAVLVKTGYKDETGMLAAKGIVPDAVCENLLNAATHIMERSGDED
ncbi:MAG: D-glycero-beta-D-manno-heptose-1,7-bisphosphate 7-phosphatase [Desulfobacteraceae bacterium IS3]|jgi:D-glycero-D-manno-heptose 1,7-bisphosphate phosphatase|nr:MAG: D-glycero-beta-D-manno-heptose-1,7-bisphosphate 7-phosphatase [Desulfobacteraceae bacterium IS3]HAO22784.1 D-glycero-beta-D-manno-heptose-1,7-bisphosphate 7-phosphatase [Desulfobacteraceae bacterium]